MLTTILVAIVVGAIIGALGRLLVSGRQNISWIATIVIGIVAAVLGAFIARALRVGSTTGFDWIQLLIQIALAAFGVALYVGRGLRVR